MKSQNNTDFKIQFDFLTPTGVFGFNILYRGIVSYRLRWNSFFYQLTPLIKNTTNKGQTSLPNLGCRTCAILQKYCMELILDQNAWLKRQLKQGFFTLQHVPTVGLFIYYSIIPPLLNRQDQLSPCLVVEINTSKLTFQTLL